MNTRLTIDLGVQHIVEAELDQAMERHQQGVTAVVVRPATGEILAMLTGRFDPNRPGQFRQPPGRAADTAEPGSTFKAVTVAGALNERPFHCRAASITRTRSLSWQPVVAGPSSL